MEIKKAPIIPLTYQIRFPPLFPSSPHPKTTFEICEICVYISWGWWVIRVELCSSGDLLLKSRSAPGYSQKIFQENVLTKYRKRSVS